MAMENKRIIQLNTERTTPAADDYVMVDSATAGTAKYLLPKITDAINQENSDRASADTALQTAITNEATARTNADTTLQGNITAEATARAEADTAINGEITQLKEDFNETLGDFETITEEEITSLTRHTGKRYTNDGTLVDVTPSVGTAEAVEITVTPGEVIKWVCYYANRNSTYNIKYMLESGAIEPDTNYTTSGNEYTFTVPTGCAKILASCWVIDANGNHFYKTINEYQSVKNYIDGEITTLENTVSADITEVKTDSDNAYLTKVKGIVPDFLTLFDKNNIIDGYWYDFTDGGKVKTIADRFIYPLIPCKADTIYTKRTCNICIFDSNKELITTVLWNGSAVFTTPSNAAFFGISMTTTSLDLVRLVEGEHPSGEIKQPISAISLDQIKTIIVDKTGNGDYSSLTEAVSANTSKKCRIEVRPGTYNLIDEYTALYGSDFFDSESFSDEGLVINNGSEIILDTTAIVQFDYTGSNERVSQYFSPFKFSGSGGILKGGQIKCSNCRYAIHDDTYSSQHDKRIIDGVYIYYRSSRNVAIGGGLGYSSDVELKNCYVDSGDIGYGVFYHNASYENAESIVKIHDNYFTAGIYIQPYGSSTLISKAIISNNKASAVSRITTGMTVDNFEMIAWNNVTA